MGSTQNGPTHQQNGHKRVVEPNDENVDPSMIPPEPKQPRTVEIKLPDVASEKGEQTLLRTSYVLQWNLNLPTKDTLLGPFPTALNLREKDNLSTKDKVADPKLSFTREVPLYRIRGIGFHYTL